MTELGFGVAMAFHGFAIGVWVGAGVALKRLEKLEAERDTIRAQLATRTQEPTP